MAKKGKIKYHTVAANVRKDLHTRIMECLSNNGYTLKFAVEAGLIMFLTATHEDRIKAKNSFVYRGRLKNESNPGPAHSG